MRVKWFLSDFSWPLKIVFAELETSQMEIISLKWEASLEHLDSETIFQGVARSTTRQRQQVIANGSVQRSAPDWRQWFPVPCVCESETTTSCDSLYDLTKAEETLQKRSQRREFMWQPSPTNLNRDCSLVYLQARVRAICGLGWDRLLRTLLSCFLPSDRGGCSGVYLLHDLNLVARSLQIMLRWRQ